MRAFRRLFLHWKYSHIRAVIQSLKLSYNYMATAYILFPVILILILFSSIICVKEEARITEDFPDDQVEHFSLKMKQKDGTPFIQNELQSKLNKKLKNSLKKILRRKRIPQSLTADDVLLANLEYIGSSSLQPFQKRQIKPEAWVATVNDKTLSPLWIRNTASETDRTSFLEPFNTQEMENYPFTRAMPFKDELPSSKFFKGNVEGTKTETLLRMPSSTTHKIIKSQFHISAPQITSTYPMLISSHFKINSSHDTNSSISNDRTTTLSASNNSDVSSILNQYVRTSEQVSDVNQVTVPIKNHFTGNETIDTNAPASNSLLKTFVNTISFKLMNSTDSFSTSFIRSSQEDGLSDCENFDDILKEFNTSSFTDGSVDYENPNSCSYFYNSSSSNTYKKRQKTTCMCTEKCKDYGNCCLNYAPKELFVPNKNKRKWFCSLTAKHFGYLVISSCPTNWSIHHVQQQCENVNYSVSDKLNSVPVSSKDSLLTYRNVYCAICNNDLHSDFWSVHMYCNDNFQVTHVNEERAENCDVRFFPPKFSNNDQGEEGNIILPLMRCESDMINNCPEKWTADTENEDKIAIWNKCDMIYAPVTGWNDKVVKYKNAFCALCNCFSEISSLYPVEKGPPMYPPSTVSFSLLLDMDFTKGGTVVGSQERCPKMHLYDPWLDECRSVMCGPRYVFKNGDCILRTTDQNDPGSNETQSNNVIDSNCLRISYSSSEFTSFENGSIMIIRDNRILLPNEYTTVHNYEVIACIPNNMSKYVKTFSNVQETLTIMGISISLISLFIKICCTLFTREKKKLPSKIVLFLSISLFFAQSLFLFGISRTKYKTLCIIVGIFMHYFFLSTFFWMNVLAYDLWKTFATSKKVSKSVLPSTQLLKYSLYGWFVPMGIILLSVMANYVFSDSFLNPRYGMAVCWISDKIALAVLFGIPLAVLLVANIAFFTMTAIEIRKTTLATKFALENSNKSRNEAVRYPLYCKLACIMGLTWCFGFIAAFAGNSVLWYLFIIFNSSQGVYVLVAFTHFRLPQCLKSDNLKLIGSRQSTVSRSSLTMSTSLSKT